MTGYLKPERRRWFIVGIIFLAIIFNYIDRQLVSILKPTLKDAFDMDDSGYALVVNIFTICYAIMYPISGWLVDKFGPGKVMFWGILTWGAASIGGGISRTFGQFAFFRGMLGLGEPTNFPSQIKAITVWFSGNLRATANSLSVAGSSIGAIIAPPLVAWIAISYGWHHAFIWTGVAAFVIALIWLIVYREPPKKIAEKASSSTGMSRTAAFKWTELWKKKSMWGILLIRFISDPVWYFCLFWLPGYLQEDSGLSLAQIGMVGWIPFLVADLGGIATSTWSDSMIRKGKKPLKSRRIMLTSTAFIAPLCILVPYLPNAGMTIAVFSLIAAMCISWLFSIPVVLSEVFPVDNVASVMGISAGFGAVGATVFNYFVGEFLSSVGAGNLFLIMAFLHPIAVLILWTMIGKDKTGNKLNKNK